MPTTVTIPGVGDVDFPDSMSQDDIGKAAHRLFISSPQSSVPSPVPPELQKDSGQLTNDVGNTVIVPKENESFAGTLARAAQQGKQTTPEQINKELATAPGKAATVLGAAPLIGAGGTAALALPGELVNTAVKHLAGNVLPGMEPEAAKQALTHIVPKAIQFAETMSKLGVGAAGLTYLLKSLIGEAKK